MPKRSKTSAANSSDLRARAEELVGRHLTDLQERSPEGIQQLVYELEVHQVELEMQNQALREAQQGLEASRDRYVDLYDFAPVGYVTLDAKGSVQQINLTAAKLLGTERTRLIGHRFAAYVAQGHKHQFHRHLRECRAGSSPTSCEVLLCPKVGAPVPVKLDTVRVEGDKSALYRTAITDITERRQAEEALEKLTETLEQRVKEQTAQLRNTIGQLRKEIDERKKTEEALSQSEEKFRTLAEQSPNMIFINKGRRVVYANAKCEELMGYTRDEFYAPDFDFWCLIAPEYLHVIGKAYARHTRGEEVEPIEYALMAKDGKRIEAILATKLMDYEGGGAILGIITDITPRKDLEREISAAAMHEQQRIGQELHDGLGQELLGLALMAKSLQKTLKGKGAPDAESAGELVRELTNAHDHVRAMIKGVRPVEVEAGGLVAALGELADSTQRLASVRCDFQGPERLAVKDDHAAAQLFHIAQEAVTNAVKHARAKHIAIGLGGNDHWLRLWVRDDGRGLPVDSGRTDGMGLRIMRYRAGLLGGSLAVESTEGSGTLITCTVPSEQLR